MFCKVRVKECSKCCIIIRLRPEIGVEYQQLNNRSRTGGNGAYQCDLPLSSAAAARTHFLEVIGLNHVNDSVLTAYCILTKVNQLLEPEILCMLAC